MLVLIMLAVIVATVAAAPLFRQDKQAALLAGGATAICGAPAALALYSLIGDKRIDQARFTLTLVGITAHPDIDTSLADAGYDFITDAFVSGRDTDGRAPGGWDL